MIPGDGRRLRILLVDDHEVVHWGLKTLFDSEPWVAGLLLATHSEQAIELAKRHEPHVAIVDLALGTESGAELCGKLRAVCPRVRVLLISGAGRLSPQAAKALGASGFVPKTWSGHDIAGATRMVGLGMTVFPTIAQQPQAILSDREREILSLIAGGATNREIAMSLFLSPHTVKDHTTSVYRKLRVRNRAEAVAKAETLGIMVDVLDAPPPLSVA